MATHSAGHMPGEAGAWSDPSPHKSGFVVANGTRLNYLDWGGSGPPLILIHGFLQNPHVFDDLAPAFTDRFRVIAYARRGHGQSDAKGPYDTATLTEDLCAVFDGLGITRAHLAGWSMGGVEITSMAVAHPDRVDRLVYLDAALDWYGPIWKRAAKALPYSFSVPPSSALASIDAYREYRMAWIYPGVDDPNRLEAMMRDGLVEQLDGTVQRRMTVAVVQAVGSVDHLMEYAKLRCPALAIYAATYLDVEHGNPDWTSVNRAWEEGYDLPFRAMSVDRVRSELPYVEVLNVPGTHTDFVFTSREMVVAAMRRFLLGR